jgi:hypothetical protein
MFCGLVASGDTGDGETASGSGMRLCRPDCPREVLWPERGRWTDGVG